MLTFKTTASLSYCYWMEYLQHGPVLKTQDVGNVYNKGKGLVRRKLSMKLYEVFSVHLNLAHKHLKSYSSHLFYYICSSTDITHIVYLFHR